MTVTSGENIEVISCIINISSRNEIRNMNLENIPFSINSYPLLTIQFAAAASGSLLEWVL